LAIPFLQGAKPVSFGLRILATLLNNDITSLGEESMAANKAMPFEIGRRRLSPIPTLEMINREKMRRQIEVR